MIERLRRALLENPPTVGEAAVAVVIALLAWAGTSADKLPVDVPGYVVWPVLVLAGVLAIGGIGRITQRFTWPTDWLDGETVRALSEQDGPE